jgi:hypothetical protein
MFAILPDDYAGGKERMRDERFGVSMIEQDSTAIG